MYSEYRNKSVVIYFLVGPTKVLKSRDSGQVFVTSIIIFNYLKVVIQRIIQELSIAGDISFSHCLTWSKQVV